MTTFLFIIGIVLFILLIVAHELGHAIVAKRNGVVVDEFGVFFPPRLWKKKLKNGVLLTFNAVPLGGFVRMQGESDDSNKKGDYGSASLWAKTKILLAGVGVNWLIAIIIFTLLALTAGIPKLLPNQFSVAADSHGESYPVLVSSVAKNTPAAQIGLEKGDEIIKLAGDPVGTGGTLVEATKENAGKTVSITYRSDGKTVNKDVTLQGKNSNNGQLGAAISQEDIPTVKATWSAPIVGIGTTAQFTWVTLKGVGAALGNLVVGLFQQLSFSEQSRQTGGENISQAGKGVAGPVGIVAILLGMAERGFGGILFLIAVISLSLALINTLPIPALDGGRLAVTLIFRGLKKRLTRQVEEKINATGFIALIGLIVLITIVDINRLSG